LGVAEAEVLVVAAGVVAPAELAAGVEAAGAVELEDESAGGVRV